LPRCLRYAIAARLFRFSSLYILLPLTIDALYAFIFAPLDIFTMLILRDMPFIFDFTPFLYFLMLTFRLPRHFITI